MPTLAPALTASIIAAGPALRGPTFLQVASAVGQAVATWFRIGPGSHTMLGPAAGTAGAGVVNGKLFVAPLVPAMTGAFASQGLVGPTSPQVATAIAMGIANNLNATATFKGSCAGVGAGSATLVKVTYTNTFMLQQGLVWAFAARGMVGPSAASLARAISIGTSAIVMTGSGTGVITGPTGPAPSTGVCTCFVM